MHILVAQHEQVTDQFTRDFAGYIAGLLDADTTFLQSKNARDFLRQAEEGSYDLLVVPWWGTPKAEKFARNVATEADTSVLVVKGEEVSFKRLLVCSGGRDVANPIIDQSARIAEAAGARVTLLHVAAPVPSMYTGLEAMEEGIEELLESDTPESQHLHNGAQTLDEHHVEAAIELRHGVAIDEILRATQLRDYELVVVGASDASSRLNRLFIGDLTQKILDRVPISVLIVRAPGPA